MIKIDKFMWGATSLLLFTGCVDDKYDLADIDTTSQFKVNDLVLPLQIDPVTLGDIITVEEGDELKEVTINGKTFYAVQRQGSFESDGIIVNSFTAEPSPMYDKTASFKPGTAADLPSGLQGNDLYLLIDPVQEDLEYDAVDIDGSVRELTLINFKPLTFTIDLSANNLPAGVSSRLAEVKIYIPKGLEVTGVKAGDTDFGPSAYDSASGLLYLDSPFSLQDNSAGITVTATGVDLSRYEGAFSYNPESNSGSFTLRSEFNIESAKLILSGLSSSVEEISFNVHYEIETLEAVSFLGSIAYDLTGTGLDIDPIKLDNLPDFLAGDETNILIYNPQIYLSLNNPVGNLGLGYRSGLEIMALRDNSTATFPLGAPIEVGEAEGTFNFLLAPNPEEVGSSDIPAGYETDIRRLTYSNLGNLLSGNGLPSSLDIRLIDPMIPEQKLTSPFQLGKEIPGMKGTYEFLAPLALTGDSRIIYTKTEDGWYDEDLAALTITTLTLTATASNNLPLDAIVEVFPLDKDGNRIKDLELTPATLQAGAQNAPLEFVISGTITDLDGVFVKATVTPDSEENKENLSPSQTITLNDIRVKVSGNYTKKL